ncbi:Zn(II)2Cys6 transcription factor [Aspergillus alliaceus]|uniref:Zn(II)2Cys6 transcription factor n=1 Tax=Petromyces alliaceus TaxID=209559 RepID=UPI0012A55775|nr:uncharacterized protein BDW43DRAFT_318144 [Aspergillus alliaceus]KAB8235752.1 hypothetical protein BDW43DRAFT_318144 [Aspergillus alliaceus]
MTGCNRTIISRRSHRKSRNGCSNCKRRRIKCDEVKPACGQCINHSVLCQFSRGGQSDPTSSDTSPPSGPPGITSSQPPETDLPKPLLNKDHVYISSTQTDFNPPKRRWRRRQPLSANPGPASETVSPPPTNHMFQFSTADLGLFHHYITSTSTAMADDEESRYFMQTAIPQLGFRFHHILHLLLAFSGYHIAHLDQNRSSLPNTIAVNERIAEADRHYDISLRQVSYSIRDLNETTCHAVYSGAVLICLCHLGKGPRAGEYIAFSDSNHPEWLTLLRGVRSIVEMTRDVFSIDPVPPAGADKNKSPSSFANPTVVEAALLEWKCRLQEYQDIFTVEYLVDDYRHAVYSRVVERLAGAFDSVYQREDAPRGEKCAKVFQWLYQLPEEFILDLQQRKWLSLLLLSYFIVLLKQLDSYWFIQGWPEHVMSEIYRSLDEQQRCRIRWQMDQVGWQPPVNQT